MPHLETFDEFCDWMDWLKTQHNFHVTEAKAHYSATFVGPLEDMPF